MKKHALLLGLSMVMGVVSNAVAKDRFCCCDPMPAHIQAQCCAGILLPYHVSLQRADDATKAEAALAQVTQEKNDLQAEMAKLRSELQTAVAQRDKAASEKDKATSERNKATTERDSAITERNATRAEATESAKVAKDFKAQTDAAKQAATAATKAKQDSDLARVAAEQAKNDLAKLKEEISDQLNRTQIAHAKEQQVSKQRSEENAKLAADLKKSGTEIADLKQKIAALEEKKDKKDDQDNKTADANQDAQSTADASETKLEE